MTGTGAQREVPGPGFPGRIPHREPATRDPRRPPWGGRIPLTGPTGEAATREPGGAIGTIGGAPPPGPTAARESRTGASGRTSGEVVVLLPALNEEPAIGGVIDGIPRRELRASGFEVSVWVVDGQSTDGTLDVARRRGASTFTQTGSGKGNGMRQALAHLLARPRTSPGPEGRMFVMLDADGTYPTEEIPRFVEALRKGHDVILGSRLSGEIEEGAISGLNLLGNRLLSALARILFRTPVTDVCTGMWAFRADALRRFGLVAEGFDLEADLFAAAWARGVRIAEIPIPYRRRIGEPKLVPLRTGLVIAWRLIVNRLNRREDRTPRALPPRPRALEEAV